MPLQLFVDLLSQPCRAVVLFLRINKIEYEQVFVSINKGEHKSDWFTKLNPIQRVPVILHDNFNLGESVAIFEYLANKFPIADHWYPKEAKSRARVSEYLNWQHANLRLFGSMYFRHRILRSNQSEGMGKISAWDQGFERMLRQMEQVWLAKSSFVNGFEEITVADLLAVCELEQPTMAGYDYAKDHSKIVTYMDHVRTRLDPELYDSVHTICRKLGAEYVQSKI